MMKIAIVGFDREGKSALRFLRKHPRYRKAAFWVLDKNPAVAREVPRGVRTQLGKTYLRGLNRFDLISRTPGAYYLKPEFVRARRAGVRFTSATKLFFDEIGVKRAHVIGVTGTKGKGTTSTLIYRTLRAGGKKAFLAGNIGLPPLDILPKIKKNSWVVLELSSFQLMDMERSPHIAVALMVTAEHLDWHAGVREYVAAKANIVRHQGRRDYAVLAQDYPRSAAYARATKARVFTFSRKARVRKGTWVEHGYFWFSDGKRKERVCAVGELRLPGEHNWENAAAAIAVGKILHVPNAAIARAIRNFTGLEHRLEFVAEVSGVKYYNDSYATTPETAIAAIAAFREPKVLILGGSPKGSDFTALGRAITKSKTVRAIIGIGIEWPRIRRHIRGVRLIEGCKTMRAVVRAAARAAARGDVVLLSPACASFGMFKNYTDRGNQFKAVVRALR